MKKKSAKLNYIYNLAFQIFSLITPLVTAPYISRVLGSAMVGQYSYTASIVSYFVLFGAYGFTLYAQREIARNQGNKYEQSKTFWEMIIARLITVTLATIVHIILILAKVYGSEYTLLMWILLPNIVSTAFSVSFLFQGNEEFGFITLRSVIVKTIGIACIFIFVKNEKDLWIYVLCNVLITVVSEISLWTRIPKRICSVKASELNIKKHFIPSTRLFIPTIATSIYTMLDKTLIGIMIPGTIESIDSSGEEVVLKVSDIENGFYEQAEKLVKMCLTIITAFGTVIVPKNSSLFKSGNIEEAKRNVYNGFSFAGLIGFPIMFGLAAVASSLIPWFLGPGYEKVPYLIIILSLLIICIGFNNVLGIQYLIPAGKDKIYTITVTAGAVFNLIVNLILIPLLFSYGAAIATVIAELLILILQFVFVRKELSFARMIKSVVKSFIAGTVMFGVVYCVYRFLLNQSTILDTFLLVLIGIVVYLIMLIVLRDKFFLNQTASLYKKIFKKDIWYVKKDN